MLGQKILLCFLVMTELCLISVNSKQFQDVIFTKQSDHSIQHMAFDPGSKSFYIGATNALYRLNDSYHEIESVGDFPCFVKDLGASCIETKPSNKNYNQLLLVTNNYILTCGTHYLGLCEKRNLTNISSILTSEDDQNEKNKYFISSTTPSAFLVGLSTVVINKKDNKSQEILLFGKKFSNAATEANKYYPIFARTVDQLMSEDVSTYKKSMIKAFTLMIDNNKKESYPIQFISAMETDNFIYFLTIQNSSSKIVKFCKIYDSDQDTVQTYEDLALECDVDGERFTKIKDGTFVKTTNNGFVLVTTFSFSSSKAAVCVWSEEEIHQELKKSRVYRCSGNDVTGNALKQKPGDTLNCPSILMSSIDIKVVPFCSFYGLSYLSLIIGITPAMENSSYDIDDDSLTKVVGTTINKQSIVYVGTTSGKVKSLYLDPSTFKLTELRTYDISNQTIIGLQILDDKVYVVTESKIVQLTEPTCLDYKTCTDCMSAKSVQCGWCIESQKCTLAGSENCQFYENSNYWLPSVRGSCLTISYARGFGGRPYDDGLSILPIKLTLNPELTPLSGINFTCQMVFKGSVENDAVFNSDYCSFRNLPTTVGMRDLNLLLNGKIIASTTYFVYDCTVYKSCGICTTTPQTDCFWCIETANCEKNVGNCGIGKPNARTNTDNCPQIKQLKDSRLQNGHAKDLIFTSSNLPSGNNTVYKCIIESNTFQGNRISETQLSCSNVLVSYQENIGTVSKVIEFKYGPGTDLVTLENFDGQTSVEVYKCSKLSMDKRDCSFCIYLNQTLGYECKFCSNECSDTYSCPVSDIKCGSPVVNKVDPVRGPVGGGTRVSIFGINLGVQTQDVSNIKLASVNCINITISSEGLNQRLTCTSSSSGKEMKGPVSITVNGQSSQTANVEFEYKEPRLITVYPNYIIRSGGGKITIGGQNFLIGNRRHVTLQDVESKSESPCEIQNTEDRSIICEVGASAEKNGFPRRQDIVLTIDEKTTKTLQGQFYYLPNPIITGTIPEKLISIYSGGLSFQLIGRHFTSNIQNMGIKSGGGSSRCVYENENQTKCYFPPLQQFGRRKISTYQPLTVVMDGFTYTLLSSTEYVSDPIVYPVNDNKRFEFDPDTQDRIFIKGMYLRLAATEKDYNVMVGSGICDFIKVNENNISCKPPSKAPAPKGDDKSIFLRVEIGINYSVIVGIVEYSTKIPILQIIIGLLVACLVVIAIVAGVIFWRIKAKNKKEIDNHILQMTVRIADQAKQYGQEEFPEMQTNLTDIQLDVVSSGTPYNSYDKFVLHVLFPEDIDSANVNSLLEDIEDSNKNEQKAMENFERLLNNKFFLKSLISTLDKQRKLTMQDKAQFSSMLSVVMLGKMRDFFETVNCLLSKLVDSTSKRQHKTLFNGFESITLRLLSNWIFIALYPHLKDGDGSQLFRLYKAVQTVIESRPVDDVTGNAKNTLSEDNFLRKKVDDNKLLILQDHIKAVFDNVLDTDKIPTVVHYLFGVLESLANKNSVEQDTLLCWKSESYAIQIWASLIARPETLFDINKAEDVEPYLEAIKQVFIDCFPKTMVSKESSLQKLLFASEVPYYQRRVLEFYKSLSGIDTVTDQDFWNEMNKLSQMQQRTLSFKKSVALQRLFKFIIQYEDDIFSDLNEGDETKDLDFGNKLVEVFKLMVQDMARR